MIIAGRQQLALARLDPTFLGESLALRAMAVPAGVVVVDQAAAGITGLDVATYGYSAADLDIRHDLGLRGT